MSKNRATLLKQEVGVCLRVLNRKLAQLDPFCDRYQRIEAILEKAVKRYQRRLAIERSYS